MKDKTKDLIQLQSHGNIEVVTFNMDLNSRKNLDKIHHIIRQLLNMKVSNGVLMRRAVWLYRLHFIEGFYHAQKMGDKEDAMRAMMNFCNIERERLRDAADGLFWEEPKDDR